MELTRRFLLMTESLQAKADFSPVCKIAAVIQIELMSARRASVVMFNTETVV